MKPKLDTRFGSSQIQSRCGLSREADVLITADTEFPTEMLIGVRRLSMLNLEILIFSCRFHQVGLVGRIWLRSVAFLWMRPWMVGLVSDSQQLEKELP